MKRSSGILAHITSLPSKYGIGSFGKEVRNFADLLKESGTHYWQVLPFAPVDRLYSPYRSESAYAGNPLLIDLEALHERGLITDEELASCVVDEDWKVDFPRIIEDRERCETFV